MQSCLFFGNLNSLFKRFARQNIPEFVEHFGGLHHPGVSSPIILIAESALLRRPDARHSVLADISRSHDYGQELALLS